MMSELKLQAAASVTPVRAMSCVRAEQQEAACAAQAKGETSGQDDEQAEAVGGGERHARQGDELRARRAASVAQAEGKNSGRDDERAEAACGGERHAREVDSQGDELHVR